MEKGELLPGPLSAYACPVRLSDVPVNDVSGEFIGLELDGAVSVGLREIDDRAQNQAGNAPPPGSVLQASCPCSRCSRGAHTPWVLQTGVLHLGAAAHELCSRHMHCGRHCCVHKWECGVQACCGVDTQHVPWFVCVGCWSWCWRGWVCAAPAQLPATPDSDGAACAATAGCLHEVGVLCHGVSTSAAACCHCMVAHTTRLQGHVSSVNSGET